jgi:serine/threonine-protein kinase
MPPAERSSTPSETVAPALHSAGEPSRGILVGYQLGRYRLTERLGGGVMAAVYRGVDSESGQSVAIKVLLPDADDIVRERFRQEARTHRRLTHPNIVPILDEGHEPYSGITYLVMALVEGPGLNEVIELRDRLGVREAAALLAPIARALAYAHTQGVIHRDVKPSNVLLRPVEAGVAGAVRIEALGKPVIPLLSDFGIARALDSPELTGVGRTIGTPTYMSPEQCADSHELDGRSDLYSLGAVFYRCLVGRPPFSGSTTQILHAHVYEALTIPENVLVALPPAAVDILRRSLAKEPAARYPSGAAMADALEQLALLSSPIADEDAPVDATATMPALQAVQTPTTVQVLVPGVQPRTTESASMQAIEADVSIVQPSPSPTRMPGTRRRWIGAVLGIALAAIFVFGAGWAALNLLPDDLFSNRIDAPTPGVIAIASPAPTTDASTNAVAATPADTPNLTTLPADVIATPPLPATTATIDAATTPQPIETPPTPAGDIQSYWREAEEAFAAEDWRVAVDLYTLVRRINPEYEREVLVARLFESRVELAAEYLAAANFTAAARELDQALALQPDDEAVMRIQSALAALLATPTGEDDLQARQNLWSTLTDYAGQLAGAERFCGAVNQLTAALAILPDGAAEMPLAQFRDECTRARALAAIDQSLGAAAGRILYSTQEGERYNIYAAPAQIGGASTLLIADGAQVGASIRSALLAFHSTFPAEPGIALFDAANAASPDLRARRVTDAAEDARDAPPSWSPDASMIVYSSTRSGAGRSRIYVRNLNTGVEVDLGLGKDPVWEPGGSRILFNGFDERGENPGLYLIDVDGGNRLRLTDNGNDTRPAWSPDGEKVVFMSTRDGDMDIYRLSLRDGSLVQLTNEPAQDGLPAISPDSKLVIFASDRGGVWRFYVTPIDGGPVVTLLDINGVLTNWLEHSIQWTR